MKNNLNSILASIAILFVVIFGTTVNIEAKGIVNGVDRIEDNRLISPVTNIDVIANVDISQAISRNEIVTKQPDSNISDEIIGNIQIDQSILRIENVDIVESEELVTNGRVRSIKIADQVNELNNLDLIT